MTRREMLQQSFRNLSQILPAALGVVGGLGEFWKETNGKGELLQAACFPAGPQRPYSPTKSEGDHEVQLTKKEDEE